MDTLLLKQTAEALLRLPSYLSATISLTCSILQDEELYRAPNAGKLRNAARGFLTQLFTMDWFLGDSDDEVVHVLDVLKYKLVGGDVAELADFKQTVKQC